MARIIGLTGGIASGKSTVTSYLKEKGYPVKRAVVYETPNNCAAYRETEEETEAAWL